MQRPPSARHVLPGFTERTSTGRRTPDPYAEPPEERIVLPEAPAVDDSAGEVTARLMHVEHRDPDLTAREAVERGPLDGVVPGRGTSAGSRSRGTSAESQGRG
ncbi:hypothetical protein OG802_04985 [Streptomyces sp. NBC_00704]|uniref:hypothetical protein n=1 Tax=Streptomyces sp. NBC_00704 TaxID=2975809 RepID=UPI002E3006D2|nr:hypothetical protein [Streptomyces sp. NBC_00704]